IWYESATAIGPRVCRYCTRRTIKQAKRNSLSRKSKGLSVTCQSCFSMYLHTARQLPDAGPTSVLFGVWKFGVWSLEFGVWNLELTASEHFAEGTPEDFARFHQQRAIPPGGEFQAAGHREVLLHVREQARGEVAAR